MTDTGGLVATPLPEHFGARRRLVAAQHGQHVETVERQVLGGYAQCHPEEDFAETFAGWLNPTSDWADRYEGWRRITKEAANAALREDQAAWRRTNRQWGRIGREAQKLKYR